MGERDSYAPGTFCWADLGTNDADAAKAFYTSVFGWEAADTPAGDAGTYTTFKLDGPRRGGAVRDGRGGAQDAAPALVLLRLGRGRRRARAARARARRRDPGRPVRRRGVRPHDRAARPDRRPPAPVAAARAARRRPRQRARLHVLERAGLARPGPRARLLRRAAGLDDRAGGVRLRDHPARRRAQRRHAPAAGRRADALARLLHGRLLRRRDRRRHARAAAR